MDMNKGHDAAGQLPAHPQKRKPDDQRDVSSPKRGWLNYAIGAALVYGVCVVLGGRMLSSEFASILELGIVMGLFYFALLGPAYLVFQLLAHWIVVWLWRPTRWVEGILLNLPASAILAILLIGASIPPSPAELRESLKRHFEGRLPGSVDVKGYRMSRGLNEGSYTFVFRISSGDLGSLLTNTGFALDSLSAESARLDRYQEIAKELTKGTARIDVPCTVYLSETNHGASRTRRILVVGSNGVDVIFCESFF